MHTNMSGEKDNVFVQRGCIKTFSMIFFKFLQSFIYSHIQGFIHSIMRVINFVFHRARIEYLTSHLSKYAQGTRGNKTHLLNEMKNIN